MNHTPGPWQRTACHVHGPSFDGQLIAQTYDRASISTWAADAAKNISVDEQIANTSLIAAAPDLLEALEAIRTRAFEAKDKGLAIGMSDIFAITNAALAKATS